MVSWTLLNTVHVMIMQLSKSDWVDLIPDNILPSVVCQRSQKGVPIAVVQHPASLSLHQSAQQLQNRNL